MHRDNLAHVARFVSRTNDRDMLYDTCADVPPNAMYSLDQINGDSPTMQKYWMSQLYNM